ncbi:GFA family protein [Marinobacter sp. BGYM27]|uniref:GFA family protein n=1 Tax=unclassified Marinobacter TaxID=83889 RepID=UPI0021A87033|nr:GFA family protein [Marinobacter sp. BGYM27]MDG5501249.1 GFA family protein [Marinobacter sp. BGYM27]
MAEITGNCLCGEVTFKLANDFQQFHLCHCSQCQKATGSAHASNLFTAPDNIEWLSGQAHIVRYDLPGRTISNAFCTKCGSPVPYVSQSGQALVVPAGSLNQTPDMTPRSHIFWPERAAWYDQAQEAERFDAFPE